MIDSIGSKEAYLKCFFNIGLKVLGLKKDTNKKCIELHALLLLFNIFFCESNNKKHFRQAHASP